MFSLPLPRTPTERLQLLRLRRHSNRQYSSFRHRQLRHHHSTRPQRRRHPLHLPLLCSFTCLDSLDILPHLRRAIQSSSHTRSHPHRRSPTHPRSFTRPRSTSRCHLLRLRRQIPLPRPPRRQHLPVRWHNAYPRRLHRNVPYRPTGLHHPDARR